MTTHDFGDSQSAAKTPAAAMQDPQPDLPTPQDAPVPEPEDVPPGSPIDDPAPGPQDVPPPEPQPL